MPNTPLHSRHLELGGTMAPFAGWDMPLWYKAGAVKEHLAVIQNAGLFDTSHMDVVLLAGPDARAFLNRAYTRDIANLAPERCAYGAFLTQDGRCLDDAIVYPMPDGRFGLVVNASMGEKIAAHLRELQGSEKVFITLPEPRLAKIDLQGPAAAKTLARLFADPGIFAKFPYFSFKGDFNLANSEVKLADGTPILLSRTGYTGEQGFEIFLPADRVGMVWDRLLAGPEGALPCGLAARDSLRTGAVLPLSHQDIGPWPFINHPWFFALPLAEDGSFTKEFVGRSKLDQTCPHTIPFVGFDPRRIEPHEAVVLKDGHEIGTVTTIVTDMAMGRLDGKVRSLTSPDLPAGWTARGLCCGFVRVDKSYPVGTELILKDKRREIKVELAADLRPDRGARKKLVL